MADSGQTTKAATPSANVFATEMPPPPPPSNIAVVPPTPAPPPAIEATQPTGQGFRAIKEYGTFVAGCLMLGCGLLDGARDVFTGLPAEVLVTAGLALLGADRIAGGTKK